MHEEACFLTLTYDEKHLPYGNTLAHEDVQKFLKRLRRWYVRNLPKSKIPTRGATANSKSKEKPTKGTPPLQWYTLENQGNKFPLKSEFKKRKKSLPIQYLRYYMCGEYGDKTQRAHYHMCLYGWDPKDKNFYAFSGSKIKSKIYTSETLGKLWGKGNAWIGEVTFESAAYTARYIMKKVNGQRQQKHYESVDPETGEIINRKPEYTEMSLKPGIGAKWLEKYQSDVFPEGTVVARGHKGKSPKYYDKKYKKIDPIGYEDLLFEREKAAKPGENSKERLAVRETVAKAQIAFLKRNAI